MAIVPPLEIRKENKVSRILEYNKNDKCDNCGKMGADDFIGDMYCPECIDSDENGEVIIKDKKSESAKSGRNELQVKADNGGQDDNYCQCSDDEFIDFVRYCGNCGKRIKFD